jgi:hypothetical protein
MPKRAEAGYWLENIAQRGFDPIAEQNYKVKMQFCAI